MEKQAMLEKLVNIGDRFLRTAKTGYATLGFKADVSKPVRVFRGRLASIDVFRAVTMLIMIFVNDFWTLKDVPHWMEHSKAADDGMGLSDVVFPAFLFIVGLSIPYAISHRKSRNEGWVLILTHIFERTFALLLMGVFIVNYEAVLDQGMIISGHTWAIAMVVAFLLIWNVYSESPMNQATYGRMKILGYVVLVILAVIYKGDDPLNPSQMETRWWGILGLIGWTYFLVAPSYLFIGDRLLRILAVWLFFVIFNFLDFSGGLGFLERTKPYIWIVGSGSMPAFAMAGVVVSVIYRKYGGSLGDERFILLLIALGMLLLLYGFGVRPFWGISKIRATPAWVGICSGISVILFAFFFWLIDVRKKKTWARCIQPAGTDTLTCYLVPYVWYAFMSVFGLSLPMYLRTGPIGLLKSWVFAYVVIWLTGKIVKRGIKLRI
jgi:heparan-alpha-glucosaminide N-acetyltransferase